MHDDPIRMRDDWIRWTTTPDAQGQAVEVSYGLHPDDDAGVWRRIADRAAGSVIVERATAPAWLVSLDEPDAVHRLERAGLAWEHDDPDRYYPTDDDIDPRRWVPEFDDPASPHHARDD